MLAAIGTIGGLVGLAVSVALLAWQSHEVAKQTKISNAIAAASVIDQCTPGLREPLDHFMDKPELRPYFYEGKPGPRRGRRHARVATLAEMFADVLDGGMLAMRNIPAT